MLPPEWVEVDNLPTRLRFGKQKRSRSSGHTVIELLAVLTLLGILAAIALLQPSIRESRHRAEVARLRSEARQLWQAQEVYRGETGRYYTGSLDAAAIRAAEFSYTPRPDLWVVVEDAAPDHWVVRLAVQPSLGKGPPRRYCRLTLTGSDADQGQCVVESDWDADVPFGGASADPQEPGTPQK